MSRKNEKNNFSKADKSEKKSNLTPLTNPEDVAGGFDYGKTHSLGLHSKSSYENKFESMSFTDKEQEYLEKHGYTLEKSDDFLNPISSVKDSSGKELDPEEIVEALKPLYASKSSKKS